MFYFRIWVKEGKDVYYCAEDESSAIMMAYVDYGQSGVNDIEEISQQEYEENEVN